jgi:hypothetical protein
MTRFETLKVLVKQTQEYHMTMLQNKEPTCRVKPDAAGFTGVRTGAKHRPHSSKPCG